MSKIFPIKTATACQYKWTWSTIYLSHGQTNSCHRVFGGHIDTKTMTNFHNTPEKIKDRELMLEGKWPGNECVYCKKIEDVGGISERLAYINDLVDMAPPELENNPLATHVTPRILEVYFSNLCNQSCVYCNPMFSSVIEHEIKKYGPISKRYMMDGNWEKHKQYNELKQEFWKWMDTNSTYLRYFQILGGEPLFQPEFYECLDFFERTENPELNWKMFSNLKHDVNQFKVKIEKMANLIRTGKLKRIEIVCSIDCWGPEQEYARNGMSLDNWEKNFNTLLETPEISIFIQSTISPITLPTAYELVDKVIKWNEIKPVHMGWNIIANPPFLDPSIFGNYLDLYLNKLQQSVDNLIRPHYPDLTYLKGFITQIKSSKINRELMIELRDYLNELDHRRGQNWKAVYPWMNDIFNKELRNESSTEF